MQEEAYCHDDNSQSPVMEYIIEPGSGSGIMQITYHTDVW